MYHLTEKQIITIMRCMMDYDDDHDKLDAVLDASLHNLYLMREIIPGDGDCLFAAFRQNLSKINKPSVRQHLRTMNVLESPSVID